ncbi:MAG: transposase [Planctomycetes bacterium]|nr:transposase [Planctomycetota bacterium]
MPNYRRNFVPGGTYFFTVVTYRRRRILLDKTARTILGSVMRECKGQWTFKTEAIVLLPDHLHTIWTLPPQDLDYSRRWAWIKKEFTKRWLQAGGLVAEVSESWQQRRQRGVWQKRFWEHTIVDEEDFERHADYIHFNPVKHRLATNPRDWPHSSFHKWVKQGAYSLNWGANVAIGDMQATTGER